jgi:putative PIN family toxin of toxin-antitoxin system
MNRPQRVILDTSTLVSAALREGSTPNQALFKALRTCNLCASQETLDELAMVLGRDKFDRYLNAESRRSFAALIRRNVHLFDVRESDLSAVNPPCRDAGDHKFLALALASQADLLVSSDEDLLVLHPWREIPIITPAEFLDR